MTQRPQRPSAWPLVAGLLVVVLIVIGAMTVVSWLFRAVGVLIAIGLVAFLVVLWLRR